MTARFALRDVERRDVSCISTINLAAVPAVNAVSDQFLAQFVGNSLYFRLVCVDDRVSAFLLVLGPGHEYESLNYRFFCTRHRRFAYVDRIVVDEQHRGLGLGRALYNDLFDSLAGSAPVVCCEVNTRPPNPESRAFHDRMGFLEVGRQETEFGQKEVALLERPI